MKSEAPRSPYCEAALSRRSYSEQRRAQYFVQRFRVRQKRGAPCVHLAQQLKGSGQDATVTVYPGAHHSFDNIGRQLVYLPNVDSGANCAFQIASILGPFPSTSEFRKCFRKGATIAWNPEATEQARRKLVRSFTKTQHRSSDIPAK